MGKEGMDHPEDPRKSTIFVPFHTHRSLMNGTPSDLIMTTHTEHTIPLNRKQVGDIFFCKLEGAEDVVMQIIMNNNGGDSKYKAKLYRRRAG